MNGSLGTCLEARAVYVEIVSFVTQLEPPAGKPRFLPLGADTLDGDNNNLLHAPSALLRTSAAVSMTRDLLRQSRIDDLGRALRMMLERDVDVACAMLEVLSRAGPPPTADTDAETATATATACALARMYMDVCTATQAPGPQTLALGCLADALDGLLLAPQHHQLLLSALRGRESIAEFWAGLQGAAAERTALSPGLADAVVRLSGSLLAVLCGAGVAVVDGAREDSSGDAAPRWLEAWGAMMSDAGHDDRVRVVLSFCFVLFSFLFGPLAASLPTYPPTLLSAPAY